MPAEDIRRGAERAGYLYLKMDFQLTVEEFVQSMEKLTTDMRFTLFNICYKRILVSVL